MQQALSPAPLSLGDGGLWTTLHDLLRWGDALNYKTLSIADLVQKTGMLDDGTPLDYAWGMRAFRDMGCQIRSHGGSWPGSTEKLILLPECKLSIAAVALDDDIERIVALTTQVQEHLMPARHNRYESNPKR